MADIKKKLAGNVAGDFFVDSTCENFDICRQLAPENFTYWESYAVVGKQPESDTERRQSLQALVSCPKGSIGTADRQAVSQVFNDFPLPVEDNVYYCGLNTIKSAGANSYFIKHEPGNWLVATPKFHRVFVEKLETMGGLKFIFLSHRDDLGEAEQYARHFKAEIIIHKEELEACPQAEHVIEGFEPVEFEEGFKIIPTPGHTEGHMMLLYGDRFLFSGDTLKYDRLSQRIEVWEPLWTWFDFVKQTDSVESLLDSRFKFEWLLPSHGQRVKLSLDEMDRQMSRAVELAKACPDPYPVDEKKLRNLEYYAAEMRRYCQPLYAAVIEERARKLRAALGL